MTNEYAYFDRSPQIVPAGVQKRDSVTINDCLKYVSLEDKVNALKHEAGIWEDSRSNTKYALPSSDSQRYCGMFTQMREILKSPRVGLEEELMETNYPSYWNEPLGASRDQTPGLPPDLDVQTTTFGKKTKSSITAAELVSPSKLPGQVLFESDLGYELYRKSHQKTHPGEKITRDYVGPNYSPYLTFGMPTPWDPSGKWVRSIMSWINNKKVCPVSQRQADYFERTKPKVGRPMEPNHYPGTCVPLDHTFGLSHQRPMHGVLELMRESEPCILKRDQLDYLKHINSLRFTLKKQKPVFPFRAFLDSIRYEDKKHTGWVPLDTVYKVCNCFNVNVDKCKITDLMKVTRILSPEGNVDYSKFAMLLNWQYDFPILPKICDIPPQHQHYETSYKAATRDWMEHDNSVKPAAGLLSKEDATSLSDTTNIREVVSPSIFTQYGVSHREFFQPRTKVQIRNIFSCIGVTLPDNIFEELWLEACKQDQTGDVCVETFRNILDQHASHQMAS